MNNDIRWAKLSSACGVITFASLLRRRRHSESKAELPEWENEGGNLASSAATDTLVTTGSA